MKLIYVSHPYGGKEENKEKVENVLAHLRKRLSTIPLVGDDPVNVFISPIHLLGHMYHDVAYEDGIQWCIELLERCDMIIMCNDWETSTGCRIEHVHAGVKGIPITDISGVLK